MWVVAVVGALLAVVVGWVEPGQAGEILSGLAPVLVFLVGVTLVAELADAAGVFDVLAHQGARWGRGRTAALWALVVGIATVTTVLLSLDTTAVLLTPVVLATVRGAGIAALPFAMTTVWLANTASLLLPISNLTNLLAQERLGFGAATFAGRMWLPALVAVGMTVLVLGLRYRRELRGRYAIPKRPRIADPVLFWTTVGVCALLAPLIVVGLPVAWVAAGAAAVLVALFAIRRREVLAFRLVPWRLVLMVAGLFVVVGALQAHGLADLLVRVGGQGSSYADLLRLAGSSAVTSNLINNLPAYAAFAPVADTGDRLLALLLGVNLGPIVTLWGSLATLLWRDRCRAMGVSVSWREFAVVGLVGVPLLLVTTTAALLVTG